MLHEAVALGTWHDRILLRRFGLSPVRNAGVRSVRPSLPFREGHSTLHPRSSPEPRFAPYMGQYDVGERYLSLLGCHGMRSDLADALGQVISVRLGHTRPNRSGTTRAASPCMAIRAVRIPVKTHLLLTRTVTTHQRRLLRLGESRPFQGGNSPCAQIRCAALGIAARAPRELS